MWSLLHTKMKGFFAKATLHSWKNARFYNLLPPDGDNDDWYTLYNNMSGFFKMSGFWKKSPISGGLPLNSGAEAF